MVIFLGHSSNDRGYNMYIIHIIIGIILCACLAIIFDFNWIENTERSDVNSKHFQKKTLHER